MSSTYDAYKQAMEKIATLQEVHVKKTVSVQSRLIKQMQDRNLQSLEKHLAKLSQDCGVDLALLSVTNIAALSESQSKQVLSVLFDVLHCVTCERDAAMDQRDALLRVECIEKLKEETQTIAHMTAIIAKQMDEKEELSKRLTAESTRIAGLQKEVAQCASTLKSKENELSRLRKALEALTRDTERSLASAKSQVSLQHEVVRAQEMAAAAEDASKALKCELRDAKCSVAQLQDEIDCKLKCSLCTEKDVDTVFHCGHTSCEGCIDSWMLRSDKCPVCSRRIGYRKKLFLGA